MDFKHGDKVLITDRLVFGELLGFIPGVIAQVKRDEETYDDVHLVHLNDNLDEDFGFFVSEFEYGSLKLVEVGL